MNQVKQALIMGLLKKVMSMPELSLYCLIGGTWRSLQPGHRIPVDWDFSTKKFFEVNQFTMPLSIGSQPFDLQVSPAQDLPALSMRLNATFIKLGRAIYQTGKHCR